VILNANEGEGLVWLSIPADDFAAAVRFFGETRAWMWRSMRGTPRNRPAENGDKIQLFVPEAPLFGHYRSRKPVSSLPGARRSGPQRRRDIRRARVGWCLDVAQVPGTWRERPWPGCAGPGPRVGSMPSDPGVYRARYGLEDRAGCDTGD
jgi:hypothetical protein